MLKKAIVLLFLIGLVAAQTPAERRKEKQALARRRQQEATRVEHREAPEEDDSETSDQCPEPTGFFADAEQCDKYYDCREGVITEKLCPDGMVFNDFSPMHEKCDLPFNIDCSQRSKLQSPKPTQNCPRLHGYFAHADANICDTFFYCVDGKFNMIVCPDGLVFNNATGICTWPDEAKKSGCSSKDVFDFTCPTVPEQVGLTHPRYEDPVDCQFFYVCVNGNIPRRNGCKLGQAFDASTKQCDWARNVPECKDWYDGRLTKEELDKLENPAPKPTRKPPTHSRRRPSRPTRKPVVVEDDDE